MSNILYKLFLGKPEHNVPAKRSAYQTLFISLRKIWNNEKSNDVGFEKILRLFLMGSQLIFPGLHFRNYFGKKGAVTRDIANEFYVLFKVLLPLAFLYSGLYMQPVVICISCYMMVETICYVASLIFVSDMLVKPRSYRRNILMLFLNYLEICFDFAVIYGGLHLLNDLATCPLDYIYFSIVTATSVGFGDIYPVSKVGKIMVCTHALLIVSFIVLFLNFFSSKVEVVHNSDE